MWAEGVSLTSHRHFVTNGFYAPFYKSEKFQEGDEGQEWITHLQDVESVLDAIDRFRIP